MAYPTLYLSFYKPLVSEIAKRKQAEEEIRESRDELDARVQERTMQLAQANRESCTENARREQTEEALRAHDRRRRLIGILGKRALAGTGISSLMDEAVALVKDTVETIAPIQYKGKRAAIASFMDITEQQKAKEGLHRWRRDWENVFQSIGDPTLILDLNHRVIAANRSAIHVTGKPQEELQGKYCYEVFHGTNKPIDSCPMERALVSGQQDSEEVKLETLGRIFRVSCTPVLNDAGRIERIIHIATDITERKQDEVRIKQSEERFRSLFEHSPVGIVISRNLKILYANSAYLRLFDYDDASELNGKTILDMMAPNYRERVLQTLDFSQRYMECDYKREGIGQKSDGTVFPYYVVSRGIDLPDGKATIAFITDITEHKQAEENLKQSFEKLQKTLAGTIQAMAMTVEIKDRYTAGHQQRVAKLCVAIAQELALSQEQIHAIRCAATVHDIGKIYVPTEILIKPGSLTQNESAMIKAHPRIGYDILKTIDFPWPVAEIVLQHHERMDGSGYPLGLKGEEILLEASILAVADVVEAMASYRPYRPSLGVDVALEEISKNRGKLYEPRIVDACLRLIEEKGYSLGQDVDMVSLSVNQLTEQG